MAIAEDVAAKFQMDFEQKIREEYNQLKRPNVLVVGRSGVGKSSLVNAVFASDLAKVGNGRPVTTSYTKYATEEVPVNIYDSTGWEGGQEKFLADTEVFLEARPSPWLPEARLE